MTARPRHTRAASWIISAKGGREMRYGRLSEARHLRSVAHHNMPISMNEKTISLVLSWSSQKIMIWGGVMREGFLVVSSGGDGVGAE